MCDPVSLGIASFAVSAASTTAGFIGQTQAYDTNRNDANATAANSYNELGQRNVQIDANQSESTLNSAIAQRQAQGRISASASASGLDATTAFGEQSSSDAAIGRQQSIDTLNSQNQRIQSGNQNTAIGIDRISQINKVAAPSAASAVIGLGNDALGGATEYHNVGGRF